MLPVLDDMLSNDRARAEGRGQSSKAEKQSTQVQTYVSAARTGVYCTSR